MGKQQIQYTLEHNETHAREREKDKQINRQIGKQTNTKRQIEKEYIIHIKNK